MEKREFDAAMTIARTNDLILEIGDCVDLTLMAARERKPIFDPMAVRLIWLLNDRGRLSLAEHEWLAHHFRAVEKGESGAEQKIESFLATGKRL